MKKNIIITFMISMVCGFTLKGEAPGGRFYGLPAFGMSKDYWSSYYDFLQDGDKYYAFGTNSMVTLNSQLDSIALDLNILGEGEAFKECLLDKYSRPVILTSYSVIVKQDGDWKHYNKKSGLPSKQCYGMAKASNGDIYITSYDGLIKYDGDKFELDTLTFSMYSEDISHFSSFDGQIATKGDTVYFVSVANDIVKYCDGKIVNKFPIKRMVDGDIQSIGNLNNDGGSIYFTLRHNKSHTNKLMKFDSDTSEVIDFYKTKSLCADSAGFGIVSCFDRKGRIWGVSRYTSYKNQLQSKISYYDGSKWIEPKLDRGYEYLIVWRMKCIGNKIFFASQSDKGMGSIVYDDDPTTVEENEASALAGIFPNPARGMVRVSCRVENNCDVSAGIVDMFGREAAVVMSARFMAAGDHAIDYDASSLPPGVYFLIMHIGAKTESVRMIISR